MAKKEINVGICLAHNYPSFPNYFLTSLWNMQFNFYNWVYTQEKNYTLSLFIQGGYQLDTMRNDVTKRALEADIDILLFLDTDMEFPADTIIRMLQVLEYNEDYEAVSGIYTYKSAPYLPQIFGKFDKKKKEFNRAMAFPMDNPFEIEGAGGGILMVKKEVFKRTKAPWFKFVYKGEDKNIPKGMGEDLYFFYKCKPKTLCDPGVICGHFDTRALSVMNYINKNKLKVTKGKLRVTKKQLQEMEKYKKDNK